ncbi:hypothetical protein AOQ84DRAFT_52862 [Glonium stellatum]|uniref:Uncharacterized protein n=1 Tax=Glonium stellatum TaxID=574774 RepID=A0A8E2EZH7_9PEZI|nr:hypothetical protein AOQ84DRAFT_52862 [Glonium stellatum]
MCRPKFNVRKLAYVSRGTVCIPILITVSGDIGIPAKKRSFKAQPRCVKGQFFRAQYLIESALSLMSSINAFT